MTGPYDSLHAQCTTVTTASTPLDMPGAGEPTTEWMTITPVDGSIWVHPWGGSAGAALDNCVFIPQGVSRNFRWRADVEACSTTGSVVVCVEAFATRDLIGVP